MARNCGTERAMNSIVYQESSPGRARVNGIATKGYIFWWTIDVTPQELQFIHIHKYTRVHAYNTNDYVLLFIAWVRQTERRKFPSVIH